VSSSAVGVWICCSLLSLGSTGIASGFSSQEPAPNPITEAQQLQKNGRFQEAAQELAHALKEAERQEAESVQVAVIADNLASVYEDLGRDLEAMELYLRSSILLERTVGPEAEISLTARSHLAMLYMETGQLSKAEVLVRRLLDIEENRHGAEDLRVADLLESLATLCSIEKRYSDAEVIFRKALGILQRLAPPDARVAMALTNLACVVEASGRHEEAASYAEQSWRMLDGRTDITPATVIKTLTVLGVAYSMLGRASLAESCLTRALASAEISYGPHHPNVAYVLQNFATVMRHSHQGRNARSMEVRGKQILKEHARENHMGYIVDLRSLLPVEQGRR
jgi:tetratricopeptide (TPR) repeat protein